MDMGEKKKLQIYLNQTIKINETILIVRNLTVSFHNFLCSQFAAFQYQFGAGMSGGRLCIKPNVFVKLCEFCASQHYVLLFARG